MVESLHMAVTVWSLKIKITEEGAILYNDWSKVVHTNTKGHSGMFMTICREALLNITKKVGLVTARSTKTEIT